MPAHLMMARLPSVLCLVQGAQASSAARRLSGWRRRWRPARRGGRSWSAQCATCPASAAASPTPSPPGAPATAAVHRFHMHLCTLSTFLPCVLTVSASYCCCLLACLQVGGISVCFHQPQWYAGAPHADLWPRSVKLPLRPEGRLRQHVRSIPAQRLLVCCLGQLPTRLPVALLC